MTPDSLDSSAAATTRTDENAAYWMIERSEPRELMTHYLTVTGSGIDDTATVRGQFAWTDDSSWAIHFSRRQDAVLVVGALRTLFADTPYRLTVQGLRPDDAPPRVHDHRDCSGPDLEPQS